MHRIFGALVGLTLFAAPAAAGDGKQAAAQAVEAAQGLQHYAAEVAAAGGRMDFVHGPGAAYLQRVFDQASFASLPASAKSDQTSDPTADLAWLMDWFGAVQSVNNTILYFGADPKRLTTLSQEQIGR